ncbi:hypothetical protein ACQ4M3_29445 [Leptolyngbya sp. AN03gr2]|uniref:hypothetical protein n=1 Tax=unclassified Leptolyngbya TaxID=2650499 RepID=UPI003D3185E4
MNSILKSAIAAQIGAAVMMSIVESKPVHALAINGAATGIASPAQTINFDDLTAPDGTAVTTQYPGITFSNLFLAAPSPFPNFSGRMVTNFSGGAFGAPALNPFSIQFSTTQTRASLALVTNIGGTTTFTALLNGAVVESFTANTDFDSNNNFYGFTGSSGFNEIQVSVISSDNGAVIDNLQIGTTATPIPFGFTPLPGLAVSGLLCGANRLRKRFAKEQIEA